jgi:hypothetical protein
VAWPFGRISGFMPGLRGPIMPPGLPMERAPPPPPCWAVARGEKQRHSDAAASKANRPATARRDGWVWVKRPRLLLT